VRGVNYFCRAADLIVAAQTGSNDEDGLVAEELAVWTRNSPDSRRPSPGAEASRLSWPLSGSAKHDGTPLLARRANRDRAPVLSVDSIVADLKPRIAGWRSLFHDNPGQARPVVKQLIVGRLDMTPHRDERYYSCTGTGTIEPLLAGVLPHSVASPRDC
jgi:hypothetical protein